MNKSDNAMHFLRVVKSHDKSVRHDTNPCHPDTNPCHPERHVMLNLFQHLSLIKSLNRKETKHMEMYRHCERMRSNPVNYFARSAEKVISLFTSHLSPSHLSPKSAFTLAEMMVVMLILSIVMAAFAPVMTTRSKVDLSSPWRYMANNSDIYYGTGANQTAVIGANSKADTASRLEISTSSDTQRHILFKRGATVLGSLFIGPRNGSSSNNIILGNATNEGANNISNIVIGINSMQNSTVGSSNVVIGNSVYSNCNRNVSNTCNWNMAIAGNSLQALTSGWGNLAIGGSALQHLPGGSTNIALGVHANMNANSAADNTIAVGYETLASANNAISMGNAAQSTADNTIAIGANAKAKHSNTIAIGYNALTNYNPGASETKGGNLALGYESMKNIKHGGSNLAIGSNSLSLIDGISQSTGDYNWNTAVGHDALRRLQAGWFNVALGGGALSYLRDGSRNIAIGTNSNQAIKDNLGSPVDGSIAIGSETSAAANSAIAIGTSTSARENSGVAIGSNSASTGEGAIAIGNVVEAEAKQSIAIGSQASGNIKHTQATGSFSIAIGSVAEAGGNSATAVGSWAEASENESVALGSGADATERGATALGYGAGSSAKGSIALGYLTIASGAQSIAIGSSNPGLMMGNTKASGETSIAIGNLANASGKSSIAIGSAGSTSSTEYANATGEDAIAIGRGAAANSKNNVAIGAGACHGVTINNATCIGKNSGYNFSSPSAKGYVEDDNSNNYEAVFIGSSGGFKRHGAEGSDSTNGIIELYKNNNTNQAIMVVNADLIVNGFTWLTTMDHEDWKESKSSFGLLTSKGYQGVEIRKGYDNKSRGGFPTISKSDRRLKYVGAELKTGLDKIRQLRVYNYTFKKDPKKTPHVGVIAQDLQKVFPNAVTTGSDGYLEIRMEDMFYALINAVKELDAKVTALTVAIKEHTQTLQQIQKDNKAKESRIKALESKNKDLEARLLKLEARK